MYKRNSHRAKIGWEAEAKSYNDLVGDRGHYFHEHIVIPNALSLLRLNSESKLLDLGCGQGILGRQVDAKIRYLGIDSSKSLIDIAVSKDKGTSHEYMVASATKQLKNIPHDFTHAAFILSLQNMEYQTNALKNASDNLAPNGKLLLVLNHPAFRIPRQSGWGEQPNKQQYRWVTRYLSFLKIPINMHPGQKHSATTISYHNPISFYVNELSKLGMVTTRMEEWTSDKVSVGKAAKMENRSRSEIPLFLALLAEKK